MGRLWSLPPWRCDSKQVERRPPRLSYVVLERGHPLRPLQSSRLLYHRGRWDDTLSVKGKRHVRRPNRRRSYRLDCHIAAAPKNATYQSRRVATCRQASGIRSTSVAPRQGPKSAGSLPADRCKGAAPMVGRHSAWWLPAAASHFAMLLGRLHGAVCCSSGSMCLRPLHLDGSCTESVHLPN